MARPTRKRRVTAAAKRPIGPKVRLLPLEEAAARADLAYFAEHILGMQVGPHHHEWARIVRENRLFDIEAARGHGKSAFFSYAYVLWQMWRTPGVNGLVVSATIGQGQNFFRIIKKGKRFVDEDGVVFNLPAASTIPALQHLVPADCDRSWTLSEITFLNGSRVQGTSFGSSGRGFHGQFIVVDDPHSSDVAFSEIARERDYEYLTRDLMPMLLPGGQLALVGTPLHPEDIHGRNAKNPEWHHQKFPAYSVVDGIKIPLWPALRPISWIERQARAMSSIAFNQEYLLIPASNEASLFPNSLFHDRPETLAHWLRLRPTPEEMAARGEWTYFAGVDLAYSTSDTDSDYTVVTVLGVDPHGGMHIVEMERSRGLWYHQQLKMIEDVVQPYWQAGSLALVFVESNAMQRIFGDDLARTTNLPFRKFETRGDEKNSLTRGVPSLRMYLENGKLRIPRADAKSRDVTDVLISEMQAFGWHKGKLQGVGVHDDTVMSLWIATMAVRKGAGFFFEMLDLHAPPEPEAGPGGQLNTRAQADDAPKPWKRLPDRTPTEAEMSGADGIALMASLGYVPTGCTLAPVDAGVYIWRQVNAGRSPCWGCSADRDACGGLPPQAAPTPEDRLVQIAAAGMPTAKADAPSSTAAERAAVVAACGGDESLANMVPRERDARMTGFRALHAGAPAPTWVAEATRQGKADALYDALERLLS